MIKIIIKNIGFFILLLIFQIFFLNKLHIKGYIDPYVYIILIIQLPLNINRVLLLFIGFFIGTIMDSFIGTPGLHTFSTTLISFLRPNIISTFFIEKDYPSNMEPKINNVGTRTFMLYSYSLILIHHTALFFLEKFNMSQILTTLFTIFISSIVSLIFIIIIHVILGNANKDKKDPIYNTSSIK